MAERKYDIELIGKDSLLMHWDNIDGDDIVSEWRHQPEQKGTPKGDDRSPSWTWIYYLYNDGQNVVIPGDNFSRCMLEAGTAIPVPDGKGGKTFKSQSQSGMMLETQHMEFLVDGQQIPMAPITELLGEKDFKKHRQAVNDMGFSLFLKRARISLTSKHIRVRPRFERWSARGRLVVWDDQITGDILKTMLHIAGNQKGLGDWRPSSPKSPGPYGRFDAKIKKVK